MTLYGDDGEMQCNNMLRHRPIDFKRDTLKQIEEALEVNKDDKWPT